jgi:hypothetical protein
MNPFLNNPSLMQRAGLMIVTDDVQISWR